METTLTSKGQATIPKHIRDSFGLKPGSRLRFDLNAAGELVMIPADPKSQRVVLTRAKNFELALQALRHRFEPLAATTAEVMEILRGED